MKKMIAAAMATLMLLMAGCSGGGGGGQFQHGGLLLLQGCQSRAVKIRGRGGTGKDEHGQQCDEQRNDDKQRLFLQNFLHSFSLFPFLFCMKKWRAVQGGALNSYLCGLPSSQQPLQSSRSRGEN